jgi:hypothetical protein
VAARTGIPADALVKSFGRELFSILADGHRQIMDRFDGCLDMLAGIESIIHRDVRKLYSDAELPRFDVEANSGDHYLRLVYSSSKPFADLAEGLIDGALLHYDIKDISTVTREDLADDGTHARFEIKIAPAPVA